MGLWVGFDFDGTLVEYPKAGQPYGPDHNGVVGLLRLIKDSGATVKIMSARAAYPQTRAIIQGWLDSRGLGDVEITDKKDFEMVALFDDLAITVNNGSVVTPIEVANNMLKKIGGALC